MYQSICESLQHPSPSGDSVLPGNISFPFVTVCKLHCCIWKSSSFFFRFISHCSLNGNIYIFIIFEQWVMIIVEKIYLKKGKILTFRASKVSIFYIFFTKWPTIYGWKENVQTRYFLILNHRFKVTFKKKNNQKTRNSNLLYPSITHYHCKFQTLQLPRQISLPTIHYQVFDYATTSPLLRNPSKNGKRPAYTRCSVIRDTTEIIFLSLNGSILKIYPAIAYLFTPSTFKTKI